MDGRRSAFIAAKLLTALPERRIIRFFRFLVE
jgi:hypothetical protein